MTTGKVKAKQGKRQERPSSLTGPMQLAPFVGLREAARRLDVSPRTLYNRLGAGTIPELRAFKQPGPFKANHWCIPIEAIDAIVAQRAKAEASE